VYNSICELHYRFEFFPSFIRSADIVLIIGSNDETLKRLILKISSNITVVESLESLITPVKKYDTIIFAHNKFMTILDVNAQRELLNNLTDLLTNEGKIILNIKVLKREELLSDPSINYHLLDIRNASGDLYSVVYEQREYDDYSQIYFSQYTVDFIDTKGYVSKTILFQNESRYTHRWEMEHLLALTNLEVNNIYANSSMDLFIEGSDQMVFMIQRKEAATM
jgi:hypothetical protein